MTQRIARIDVWANDQSGVTRNRWVQAAHQLGYPQLTTCREGRVFFLRGDFSDDDLHRITYELLVDPVTESATINPTYGRFAGQHIIDVAFLAGVTDPVAENLVAAAQKIGINGLQQATTGHIFHIEGVDQEVATTLAHKLFHNPTIQQFSVDEPIVPPFVDQTAGANNTVEIISIRDLNAESLEILSRVRRLSLNLEEMLAIQAYYVEEGRDPTDVELEMLAQTWSEHCVHKTFKATIEYLGPLPHQQEGQTPQIIHGLLKTYIRRATEELNRSWVRSAFVDNAGIIAFDDVYDIAFKVETHNHPSAIEPFGGANTGVGGVIRDVLGVSARPIANTDVLCFGPQDIALDDLPEGVLHPRLIADGVIHGIEDYGNKMGIPTVNGAVLYHEGYTANPLVYCGCVGILPRGANPTQVQPYDFIVVLGGRTGRDGLRGATFSSMEMDGTTGHVAGSSVQIGHPIHEKQVQEVILRAREERLYNAITDCGAGGLSSAIGEMGATIGATVQLKDVPLKYRGLAPWEIWLSEAQERMVLAVPPQHWPRLKEIVESQDVEAVKIGTFEPTARLLLYYGEQIVGDLDMHFLHEGIPTMHLKAVWTPDSITQPPSFDTLPSVTEALLRLLQHPNIRSKEWVVRRYDHEIQSGTMVKPFAGIREQAPNNSAVLVPRETQHQAKVGARKGIAISNGICPQYGEIDPYAMAWAAIDEAIRNVVAVGADPSQIAILDNFCWGNPQLADRLGSLVRCVQGCYDAAIAYGVPFISGKDSLNNEYTAMDGSRHAIPPTLLISAIGIVPDIQKTVTSDLKSVGNRLYQLGQTRNELGGSHLLGKHGGTVPQPNYDAPRIFSALHQAIQKGYVRACHDLSEGGLAVTLAEMCIGGQLGAKVNLAAIPQHPIVTLFSESLGRFIVEVPPNESAAFEALFEGLPCSYLGEVIADPILMFVLDQENIEQIPVVELTNHWKGKSPLSEAVPTPSLPTEPSLPRPPKVGLSQKPRVIILHANGTNRDWDAAMAIELAGGIPEIVHINQLINGQQCLNDYQMLVLPGGFSYGDDLGAGVLWAKELQYRLNDMLHEFITNARPILGICNGFQVLVKAGLLPGPEWEHDGHRPVTLTYNQSRHFECRWVYLKPNPHSPSIFTDGLNELIYCPVAHGEGRIAFANDEVRDAIWNSGLVTLLYVDQNGELLGYPYNPNGSVYNIAALTNAQGNIMGLMPHPENHIFPYQHPRYHRGEKGKLGLKLFENAIRFLR